MNRKPRIVITMGDPAGVGPEIIARALGDGQVLDCCRPVVVGDAGVMKKIIAELALPWSIRSITDVRNVVESPKEIVVLDLPLIDPGRHAWGIPDKASGAAAVGFIKKAVELAMIHEADAIVTAPINKEIMNAAGYKFAGHTELLAELTGSEIYGMMFVGGGLRLILATIHAALRDVPAMITKERVVKTIRLAHSSMKYFGMPDPRIGVAALNPHAGEGKMFGGEDKDEILPAIQQACAEGINASGPVPADTLFYKALNKGYDIVVAMYHDQGLAPLKMLAFGNAVNITVGLPIIRTSVDHGTAYDIAGKGKADPSSLIEAVKLAAAMSVYRNREREAS